MFFPAYPAFLLFFLSDYNDAKLHKKFLLFSFPLGVILLSLSIIMQLDLNAAIISDPVPKTLVWILFVFFIVIEIYTLFFAFPLTDAYNSPGKERPVHSKGVYALCRHPGFLWLFFAFICICLVAGFPIHSAVSYTMLNLALIIFEDVYVFPRVILGYKEYKIATPFILPNIDSINRAFGNKSTESVT